MKYFVLSESVASKLSQTFIGSEVMQTAITQFIRKNVDDAVTDVVYKRAVTMFAKKMRNYDKTTVYLTVRRVREPTSDIVIREED